MHHVQLPVPVYRSEERAIFSPQRVLLMTSKQPYISDYPVREDFNMVVASRGAGGGEVLYEFLGGDVALGPRNP